jgi:hypothetical protein
MVKVDRSRHQVVHIFRRRLILRSPFAFAGDGNARHFVEIVSLVLALTGDEQILFLEHQILSPVVAHFEIGRELDGICWASILAKPAEDAPRGVDPKEFGVTPSMCVFGRLQCDAVDWTDGRTEIAGNAPFLAVWIASEHDAPSPARPADGPLLGILDRGPPSKRMTYDLPRGSDEADHVISLRSTG